VRGCTSPECSSVRGSEDAGEEKANLLCCEDMYLRDVKTSAGSEACVDSGGRGGEFVRGLLLERVLLGEEGTNVVRIRKSSS
jgi:hypothetical protein